MDIFNSTPQLIIAINWGVSKAPTLTTKYNKLWHNIIMAKITDSLYQLNREDKNHASFKLGTQFCNISLKDIIPSNKNHNRTPPPPVMISIRSTWRSNSLPSFAPRPEGHPSNCDTTSRFHRKLCDITSGLPERYLESPTGERRESDNPAPKPLHHVGNKINK